MKTEEEKAKDVAAVAVVVAMYATAFAFMFATHMIWIAR